jgi:2-keto-4-pentenoate hydratase/2-oxohepta-3-ene-1,7-dioic acid hydratase in catechol pathway
MRPKVSTDFDYEGELAVIIGTSCRHVAPGDAFAQVAGYACYNDGSVRDWQRHTHQFTPGKNFMGTGPFGPWMVTPDEVGAIGPQRLQTRVNGQVVQDATLGEMLFDIPTQIAYCSTFTRLEPGDVIATGTPGGVGAKRTPPLWLKPGDVVEVEIDRVGLLRNTVADET